MRVVQRNFVRGHSQTEQRRQEVRDIQERTFEASLADNHGQSHDPSYENGAEQDRPQRPRAEAGSQGAGQFPVPCTKAADENERQQYAQSQQRAEQSFS